MCDQRPAPNQGNSSSLLSRIRVHELAYKYLIRMPVTGSTTEQNGRGCPHWNVSCHNVTAERPPPRSDSEGRIGEEVPPLLDVTDTRTMRKTKWNPGVTVRRRDTEREQNNSRMVPEPVRDLMFTCFPSARLPTALGVGRGRPLACICVSVSTNAWGKLCSPPTEEFS